MPNRSVRTSLGKQRGTAPRHLDSEDIYKQWIGTFRHSTRWHRRSLYRSDGSRHAQFPRRIGPRTLEPARVQPWHRQASLAQVSVSVNALLSLGDQQQEAPPSLGILRGLRNVNDGGLYGPAQSDKLSALLRIFRFVGESLDPTLADERQKQPRIAAVAMTTDVNLLPWKRFENLRAGCLA